MNLRIRERIENYRRVLAISRKPTWDEFKHTARICALGIIVIGIIGFILYLVSVLIPIFGG